jgi:spermidine dehydrogenase
MYDLVVVGGGISGLSAAWYFRERFGNDARILVLDNMDDFGGHAKRNEFEYNGKQMMITGGSAYFVAPPQWTADARRIIERLAVGAGHPSDRIDRDLYKSMGLQRATYFDKQHFGKASLVRGGTTLGFDKAWLAQTPFSERVKADLDRFVNGNEDYLPGMTPEQKVAALRAMSYRDYMLNCAKLHPDVVPLMRGIWCLGADMGSAWFAFFRMRPGFNGIGVPRPAYSPESPEQEASDFQLPAGNSDLARLIVRDLIPDALPAGDFAQIQTARTDYTTLDRPGQKVRIRLSSIVTQVRHIAQDRRLFDPDDSECQISYLNGDQLHSVMAKNVVMACHNNIVPYLIPELPEDQKTALHDSVRAVNQVTSVLFRNWEAFARLKLSGVDFPYTFYGSMGLSPQRYLGALTPSRDPSEPMIISFNTGSNSGILSNEAMVAALTNGNSPAPGTYVDDQFRIVRAALIQTPFETFERAVRTQAANALAGSGFDPARDILAITVNRWGHGFTTGRDSLFQQDRDTKVSPTILAKQKFGRISICNSDAGAVSTCATAMDEAFRAVRDLEQRRLGYYEYI